MPISPAVEEFSYYLATRGEYLVNCSPALLILLLISSSSPPQPQNLLENPLTLTKSFPLMALTPPKISLYGSLYLNLSIAVKRKFQAFFEGNYSCIICTAQYIIFNQDLCVCVS